MISFRKNIIFFFWLAILFFACSPQGPVGHAYHNMAAHYNGYFYAKERINEIENQLYDQYGWNYNAILPIFPQYDTTVSKSFAEKTEDCIKKASIAIQQHPQSRWEYDAYILVGKARLYGSEFPEAVETFKYVNTKGEMNADRHHALAFLLRTFVEAGEMKNAVAVSDYLAKQELSTENKRRVYMNRAYMHQKRDELSEMVSNLVKAEELMNDANEKARIDFIIGQVYQTLGFDANAYEYYKQSLKKSPTYELSFYTKLNMAQVTQLTSNNTIKRVNKYFKKLLNDPKNLEYRDRIYYEMGDFALKQGKLEMAMDHYRSSIRASIQNDRQKAYSYLKLGRIYYDTLKNFPLAKSYYDSTITVLPQDEPEYQQVLSRQQVLEEFVQYLTTVQENDSLLSLTTISEDSLNNLLDAKVALLKEEDDQRKKEEAEKKKKKIISSSGSASNYNPFDSGPSINSDLSGTWYFYNDSEKNRGIAEFKATWGDRKLEDNWRRSNKTESISEADEPEIAANTPPGEEEAEKEVQEFDLEAARSKLLSGIPSDSATLATLNAEIEEAYYQLGNIYNFKLLEKQNAINIFDTLLYRYPLSDYVPEVLYQQYLLNKAVDTTYSIPYSTQLIEKYPESVYTKLIFNPNYREENEALNERFSEYYEIAYRLYEIDSSAMVVHLVDTALMDAEETDYTDNLKLLRAMAYGKLEGIYKYQFELNNFIKENPDSELVAYAEKLVTASEDYQINLYSSSRAKFIQFFNDQHYFILVYNPSSGLAEKLSSYVNEFIKENNMQLNTGNLVLDKDYAMILVNDFPGQGTAEAFLSLFNDQFSKTDLFKGQKLHPLVITKDNFDILYETKDLESYLSFFEKNYL